MNIKGFQLPKAMERDEATFTDTYGKFFIQPLERGFGLTIGNALRRVLLSSLQGAAITAIKIDGVLHEFASIPGVVEDVTEIVLALKGVRIKYHAVHPKTVSLELKNKKEITAADLQVDPDIEILNPTHHIATLDEKITFKMEFEVGVGKGYVPAELNKKPDQPLGTVALDALFSPIRKVNYTVDNVRVGQRTDYDKLILEVWTDGSVMPDDAVAFAAKLLKDHLQILINFKEEAEQEVKEEVDEETKRIRNLLNMSVKELELSVRSANCLNAANIRTIGDLVARGEQEMLKYRNFGRKSLSELNEILAKLGLSFGMDVEKYLGKKKEETKTE
jgi:DNA-directed RNA polymerase subunit alpha